MNEQLPMDFEAAAAARRAAEAARDAGINLALEHADAVAPAWAERAYTVFLAYAKVTPRFTAEQMREACADQIEAPPQLRAWGGIIQKASRAGIIHFDSWSTMKAANVHCSSARVWRSALYFGEHHVCD